MRRDDLPPDSGDDARDGTSRDTGGEEGDHDPDRAAILARRKRFIAIALSGLTSGVGCAQPCLSIAQPNEGGEQPSDPQNVPPGTPAPSDTAPPEACLKVARPPDQPGQPTQTDPANPTDPTAQPGTTARPEACLKVAMPPEKEPDPSLAEPRPCLKVAPPKDPPKKPDPTPCLRVAPKPDPTPAPEACLKIARPRDK